MVSLLLKAGRWLGSLGGVLLVSACALGPDYSRPVVDVGEHFHYAADYAHKNAWKPVSEAPQPASDSWWEAFDDVVLNTLMQQMLENNADLERAQAQYRQAQASLQEAQAGFFPSVNVNAQSSRSGSAASVQNQHSLSLSAAWEPDLWGRIRRTTEASEAGAKASEADLAGVRLSLQSLLAQTYFRLRSSEAQSDLMQDTIRAYTRSLEMNNNRLAAGIATPADVANARAQLENARIQAEQLKGQRHELLNALAVLLGQAPSHFSLVKTAVLAPQAPQVPLQLPAVLLQQRPDIIAANARAKQANAAIGIAQAAWLPNLSLSAQGGFRSDEWAQWLTAPARFWTLGPALALAIFDGGARQARLKQAQATYDAQAASYRQTVLSALQEVEDSLARLASLIAESQLQARALDASLEALQLTQNQFDAGMIDYLSVVQVQTSALAAQRSQLSLRADRLIQTVALIAALGGAWD